VALRALLPRARVDSQQRDHICATARLMLAGARHTLRERWVERFMQQYSLGSDAGIALLALAEAYLRVPDAFTANQLIRDKLARGEWSQHFGKSDSGAVNTATLGLMLGRALVAGGDSAGFAQSALQRLGEPAIRQAVMLAMRVLGGHFVFGRDLAEAVHRAERGSNRLFRFSFDMLGESARTQAQAQSFQQHYLAAIRAVGESARGTEDLWRRNSVSVKLSALYPRYESLQAEHAVAALSAALLELARAARQYQVGLTVDAEESDRLAMSLDIFSNVAHDAGLRGWDGLGLAIQAYQKRAPAVIDWTRALAEATHRRISVRLVKGAYWDSEIKRAQERGLSDFPVFTRKSATDVSFLANARSMLNAPRLYPAFATHNAHTAATVLEWAGDRTDFEFQRLHGMGDGLYEELIRQRGLTCRVYAPVGGHAELLPYLVRRLLENGANASFVHRLADPTVSEAQLLADPVPEILELDCAPNAGIAAPSQLFASGRRNSAGLDLSDRREVSAVTQIMRLHWERPQRAAPIISGVDRAQYLDVTASDVSELRDPADLRRIVGHVLQATRDDVLNAMLRGHAAQPAWAATPLAERAACLERLADLVEQQRDALMALLVREAGKTLADAHGEVREAVDFCRYYALQAQRLLQPQSLPGPTGEHNELRYAGRGVFVCISPWNFPLAIFLGQISAALIAGNAVACKSAPQTPLIAAAAVRLILSAGVPPDVIAFLPGATEIGAALVSDARVAGVAFTGSTATAAHIAASLYKLGRPLVPLIAETGGVNAMIVDSTALPEQVVTDVITSAFLSAGQRCSALRLLCLQDDVADSTLNLLQGALATIRVGDPAAIDTDIGPVIDAQAREHVEKHVRDFSSRVHYRLPMPASLPVGHFVAPTIMTLARVEDLKQEVFGPVLHVVRWQASELDTLVERINGSGYGLTLGVHSRLADTIERVRARARVGNLYVNRSMVGAVVESQPFGGEGLSGTGPKAGGPNYLLRFVVERTVSINTTAAGGNAALLSLENAVP
jgi:RHH-type proline utilization regulon transcriptional repressor/proline dehydrogenase/delta 1-pyrroline-5-carboxylate dehydrogenase